MKRKRTDSPGEDPPPKRPCVRTSNREDSYEVARGRVLDHTWEEVVVTLRKLEEFVERLSRSEKRVPWDFAEHSQVFTKVYDLCTMPDCNFFQKRLYSHYGKYVAEYLSSRVLTQLQASPSQKLLGHVVQVWKNYRNIFVKFCARLFDYLDRFFVRTDSLPSLRVSGHQVFRDKVFVQLRESLNQIILTSIARDRVQEDDDGVYDEECEGEDEGVGGSGRATPIRPESSAISTSQIHSRPLLRDAILMYMDMGLGENLKLFQESLEGPAEGDAFEAYARLSKKWINCLATTDYMKKAERKIKLEIQRMSAIFPLSSSRNKMMHICREQLLVARRDRLLHKKGSGVIDLIEQGRLEDLERMCQLYTPIKEGLLPIAQVFESFVKREGRNLYEKHQSSVLHAPSYAAMVRRILTVFVREFIELHDRLEELVNGPFNARVIFSKALHEGFREICRSSFFRAVAPVAKVSLAHVFAFYSDEIIRKNHRVLDFDTQLARIVKFLQYFEDRDVFMEAYRKSMSNRLMMSEYDEALEKTVISKFKLSRTSLPDVYKLEKMLGDKVVAADLDRVFFADYLNDNPAARASMQFEFHAHVLTLNFWPFKLHENFVPPTSFVDAAAVFSQFYSTKHAHRRLNWAHGRSNVVLRGLFERCGEVTFDASVFQATILLLFNEGKPLSIADIRKATGLGGPDFHFATMSLVLNRAFRLLRPAERVKVAANFTSVPEFRLIVNRAYVSKKKRVRIPLPKSTEDENRKTHAKVAADRIVAIDAAIVRIMKIRKRMNMKDLVMEAIQHISSRFRPSAKLVKRQLDSLIERDYVERDEDNRNILIYSA